MCSIKLMLFAVVALVAVETAFAIIGGQNATRGQFPYYAHLKIYKSRSIFSIKSSPKTYNCGGALISNQWVVTAAKCLRNTLGADVHLGLATLNDTKADGHEIFNVTKKDFRLYPTYKKEIPSINDIALIKLPTTVWFSKTLYIIPLAYTPTAPDTDVITMGFGRVSEKTYPTTLQYTHLKTAGLQKCWKNTQDLISKNSLICTTESKASSICVGDVGGPLISAGKLIGIASFGNDDCKLGVAHGFTGISSYTQWIESVTEGGVSSRKLKTVTFKEV